MNIILRCAFGLELDAYNNQNQNNQAIAEKITKASDDLLAGFTMKSPVETFFFQFFFVYFPGIMKLIPMWPQAYDDLWKISDGIMKVYIIQSCVKTFLLGFGNCAILKFGARAVEHFENDSQNLAGMCLHDSVNFAHDGSLLIQLWIFQQREISGENRKDFLTRLLDLNKAVIADPNAENHRGITPGIITSQGSIFILAGYVTLIDTMQRVYYALAKNQE